MSRVNLDNLVGLRFGRWTVLERSQNRFGATTYWLCRCDCGTVREVQGNSLSNGISKSCRCLRKESYARQRNQEMLGNRFGRLVVIGATNQKNNAGGYLFLCLCNCGIIKEVEWGLLKRGEVQSCGCLNSELRLARSTKHGLSGSWVGSVYANMLDRCYRKTSDAYVNYGGRGITVCDRWRFGENGKYGIECFYEDMGDRPEGLTLDRRDNDGSYSPANCRWATYLEQNHNRRPLRQKSKQEIV